MKKTSPFVNAQGCIDFTSVRAHTIMQLKFVIRSCFMNRLSPKTTIAILLSFLSTSVLWGDITGELKTYLPDYRMKYFFPRDINDITRNYNMAPYSRVRDWRRDLDMPASYKQSSAELLLSSFDEIIYFSLNMEDNPLSFPSPEQTAQLEYLKRLPGTQRFSLALTGSSNGFIPLIRNERMMQIFFANLEAQMKNYGITGIDLDWEFPRNNEEKEIHLNFLKELRAFCDENSADLSMAVSRFRELNEESYSLPDHINLMSYDFYGRHSTAESTREALEYMALRYEIPMDRIFMGIPFYGRIFSGDSPDYWKKAKSYRMITLENSVKPSDNETAGFFYNGQNLVDSKITIAEELGTGGCFIWEIGQDRLNDKSLSSVLFERFNAR